MFAWFIILIEVNKSKCTSRYILILIIFNHDKRIGSKNKIEGLFTFKQSDDINFSLYLSFTHICTYIVYKLLKRSPYFLSNSFVKTFSCKLLTMRVLCRWRSFKLAIRRNTGNDLLLVFGQSERLKGGERLVAAKVVTNRWEN